jgi:hypothetical protein
MAIYRKLKVAGEYVTTDGQRVNIGAPIESLGVVQVRLECVA